MKILILGGTIFLGRHLVEAALVRGHEVTLFNRGQHNPELFPQVEKLHGDRDGGLAVLEGRRWDAAIDTCGYVPRIVRASAEMLARAVDHYTFISTISVYADPSQPDISEASPVGQLEDETIEEVNGETYGPLKALCEQAAESAMPGRVLNVRPGLIVGPHDPTDRFTYWPMRVARGGEVLLPDRPEMPVQIIDARDLAEWTIQMIDGDRTGVFNATAPVQPYAFQSIINACLQVAKETVGSHTAGWEVSFTPVDEAFLVEAGVGPWMELPLWLPGDEEAGIMAVDISRAIAAGLTFRPLVRTTVDTLTWAQGRPSDHQWRAGLKPERERELLRAWQARARA